MPAKLPYQKWFWADWFQDTRCLSAEARGVWIDVIGYLRERTRTGSATFDFQTWCRVLTVTENELKSALPQIQKMQVGKIVDKGDGTITITCRRIAREKNRRAYQSKKEADSRHLVHKFGPKSAEPRARKLTEAGTLRDAVDRECTAMTSLERAELSSKYGHATDMCTASVNSMDSACTGGGRPKQSQKQSQSQSQSQKQSQKQREEEQEKENGEKKSARSRRLTDEEFLDSLRSNPAYAHIHLDAELGKMDAWILAHPDRQKTRRFIVNWLNKVPAPVAPRAGVLKKFLEGA